MTGVTRSQAHFGRHAGSVAAAKHQNAKKRDRTALGAGTNREFFSCLQRRGSANERMWLADPL